MWAQQHVLCMSRKLADMNDEARTAGKKDKGHHGHIRLTLVKRSKGSYLLCTQQFAERLGVIWIHQ